MNLIRSIEKIGQEALIEVIVSSLKQAETLLDSERYYLDQKVNQAVNI